MTKEAIRKREYRANKESKEQAERRRAKDNEATKKKNDMKTAAEIKAMNEANKLRMRANRDAKKLTNPQNEAPEEFLRIQTPPRSLTLENRNLSVSKNLTHEGRLPCRHDRTLSSGLGLNEDSMSEYEKLRLQNIQENKQKFQELFGISGPFEGRSRTQNQKRSQPVSNSNSESSGEEINQTMEPTRKQPKDNANLLSMKDVNPLTLLLTLMLMIWLRPLLLNLKLIQLILSHPLSTLSLIQFLDQSQENKTLAGNPKEP